MKKEEKKWSNQNQNENVHENEDKNENEDENKNKNENNNNTSLKLISSSTCDIEKLLRKKKADKKQQKDEASFCDYNPIDFMDWTARSL